MYTCSTVNTNKYLYRGTTKDGYDLDVAFLPLSEMMTSRQLLNLISRNDDPDVYNSYPDYWINVMNKEQEIPYSNVELNFAPGSKIIKGGINTGITEGWLHSTDIDVGYQGSNENYHKMVAVCWKPFSPFTSGGDSGSIYFVTQGCMNYPIAIHTMVNGLEGSHFKTERYDDQDGKRTTKTMQPASFGCNFRKAMDWVLSTNEAKSYAFVY